MGGEEGLSYEQCQKKAESDSRCSNALTSNGADFCWCVPKGWVCSHGRTRRPGYAIWGRYTPKPFGNIKTFAAIGVGQCRAQGKQIQGLVKGGVGSTECRDYCTKYPY